MGLDGVGVGVGGCHGNDQDKSSSVLTIDIWSTAKAQFPLVTRYLTLAKVVVEWRVTFLYRSLNYKIHCS